VASCRGAGIAVAKSYLTAQRPRAAAGKYWKAVRAGRRMNCRHAALCAQDYVHEYHRPAFRGRILERFARP